MFGDYWDIYEDGFPMASRDFSHAPEESNNTNNLRLLPKPKEEEKKKEELINVFDSRKK